MEKFLCNKCADLRPMKHKWNDMEVLLVCEVCNKANFEAMAAYKSQLEELMKTRRKEIMAEKRASEKAAKEAEKAAQVQQEVDEENA